MQPRLLAFADAAVAQVFRGERADFLTPLIQPGVNLGQGPDQLPAMLGDGEADLRAELRQPGRIDLKGLGREERTSLPKPVRGLPGAQSGGGRSALSPGLGLE